MNENLKVKGKFTITHLTKDREVVGVYEFENLVVDSGLNYILRLVAKQPQSDLYVGLFSGNYTPVAGDTLDTFPASASEFTGYSEASRPLWSVAIPTGLTLTNTSAKAEFNVTSSGDIYGAFISTSPSKNGTVGTLYAAKKMTAAKAVTAGDILLVQYDNVISAI